MVRHGDEDSDDFVDCMDLARFDYMHDYTKLETHRGHRDIVTRSLPSVRYEGYGQRDSAAKRAKCVNVRSCMKHDHPTLISLLCKKENSGSTHYQGKAQAKVVLLLTLNPILKGPEQADVFLLC